MGGVVMVGRRWIYVFGKVHWYQLNVFFWVGAVDAREVMGMCTIFMFVLEYRNYIMSTHQ